ncbi:MAG: hypothetical protein WCR08_05105 [Gammaproteobacteria bacterium]
MTVRTRLQEILVETPNPFTACMSIGFAGLALVASLVPKGGQPAQRFFTKVSDQYTKDAEDREMAQRNRLLELEDMDRRTAEKAAEVAAAAAPLIQQQAESFSEKRVIENKGQADLRVLGEKEKGRFQVTQEDKEQRVIRTQQDTKFALNEQEITHRTTMFSRLQEHLDTMTELNSGLTDASGKATESAKSNKIATETSYKSILGLNKAMGEVIKANSDLHKALYAYDKTVAEGDMDAEKEKAISQALLASMQAEKRIETVIATTHIQHKSELKTAFMADVADKNQELDERLHHYSKQTLDKLAYLINSEMDTAQGEIATLTNPAEKGTCQERLQKLSTMLDQVNQISLGKTEDDTVTTDLNM